MLMLNAEHRAFQNIQMTLATGIRELSSLDGQLLHNNQKVLTCSRLITIIKYHQSAFVNSCCTM